MACNNPSIILGFRPLISDKEEGVTKEHRVQKSALCPERDGLGSLEGYFHTRLYEISGACHHPLSDH